MPPALLLTAGFDPLKDEGKAYADRLSAAGNVVQYKCYEGAIHGFIGMTGKVDLAKSALVFCANAVKKVVTGR